MLITFFSQEAFPGYPELLLTAISLGRRVQEPLHEFTALYESHDEELLALKMHPLQVKTHTHTHAHTHNLFVSRMS